VEVIFMRRRLLSFAVCLFALIAALQAQTDTPKLPVRRVVLYKNGVGYFEHLGRVRGTQSLAIDFNSAQLNDVLQSLTTIDLGDGHIGNVSFNSEAPLSQQLRGLPIAAGEKTTLVDLLGNLRGARLEVHAGSRVVVGRLLSVEQKPGAKDEPPRSEVTLVTDAATLQTVTLTPSVSVRLVDRELAQQVGTYLTLLASNRSEDRRRMTITAIGTAERDVLISYVSEVPVWKTTYRIVLPSGAGQPQLQGWAIVDNTIGEDWNGVELSLVAGAPQSFIQQLSQPVYVTRPVIDISHGNNPTPQVHQSPLITADTVSGFARAEGGRDRAGVGGLAKAPLSAAARPVSPKEIEERVSVLESAAAGQDLGDLFEYRVNSPLTIHKNESALVPILSTDVTVDRVSLWNGRSARPVRSLWLTNTSHLTLDGGSFSVLDAATFAGEGLIEPMKPGEKRLLSYAVDLGVQVESHNGDESRRISRVRFDRGDVVQRSEQRTRKVYTVRNDDTTARTIVIEHPIRAGWALVSAVKPTETTANVYRFVVPVAPKATATLTVDERQPIETRVGISALSDDQLAVIIRDSRDDRGLVQAIAPIRTQKIEVNRLQAAVARLESEVQSLTADQERLRENMKSLKGSAAEQDLLKRYVAQLNAQEDRLAANRGQQADLRGQLTAAQTELRRLIESLALDVEVADNAR
jgi:hypothetical protein